MNRYKDMALTVVREVGIGCLMSFDGCACGHFSLLEVRVEVACRKSGKRYATRSFGAALVHSWSNSMDWSQADAAEIGREVCLQLEEMDIPSDLRACSPEDDKLKRCAYCHEPRAEEWGYFCAAHLDKGGDFTPLG